MNLTQIRQECWDIARDIAITDSDRLWNKAEMNRYINRIYRHIARETKCIRDATTYKIVSAPYADYATMVASTDPFVQEDVDRINNSGSWFYVNPDPAGTYTARLNTQAQSLCPYVYSLDPNILDIEEVKWTTRQWRLTKVSVSKWQINPWWEQVIGMPTEYCTDLANNKLALNFRSQTSDTLKLVVRRLPVADLSADTDIPEFRTHYHDYFINGVLWMMYSKQDADVIDKTKAEEYRQAFLRDVDEIKQQETILDQRLKPNHSVDAFR
jgi:hypothetical protein